MVNLLNAEPQAHMEATSTTRKSIEGKENDSRHSS
jgi:hypothetical protein